MKRRILIILSGIILTYLPCKASNSKLRQCFETHFESISATKNGILFKFRDPDSTWIITPLTGEFFYKRGLVKNEFFIKLNHTVTMENHSSFSFFPLDQSDGLGFFVIYNQGGTKRSLYGSIILSDLAKNNFDYTILDGQGVPVHFWTYAKESGLLEMLNAHTDTPILPPPSVTNQVVQVKEPHSKTTPIKKIIPPKTKPQRLEKVKSTPEVSIPKEPVTEQPSQIKKNLTLPISLGGFLILLGGWFFWKKGQ